MIRYIGKVKDLRKFLENLQKKISAGTETKEKIHNLFNYTTIK